MKQRTRAWEGRIFQKETKEAEGKSAEVIWPKKWTALCLVLTCPVKINAWHHKTSRWSWERFGIVSFHGKNLRGSCDMLRGLRTDRRAHRQTHTHECHVFRISLKSVSYKKISNRKWGESHFSSRFSLFFFVSNSRRSWRRREMKHVLVLVRNGKHRPILFDLPTPKNNDNDPQRNFLSGAITWLM